MIGVQALPEVAEFLANKSYGDYARVTASNGLVRMVKQYPETYDSVVQCIVGQLEATTANTRLLNGLLLSDLLDLEAVEAAPVIERAFAENAIDESIAGDWPEVQWQLGLSEHRPQSMAGWLPAPAFSPYPGYLPRPPRDHKAKAKGKEKRKQAARSRKRNQKKRK